MPRPSMRDNAQDFLGGTHVYKIGAANTTAATVVAAAGAGFYIRVKAFRCIITSANAADTVTNDFWFSDGASTALLAIGGISAIDLTTGTVQVPPYDTGMVILPGFGVRGSANTALTIDATATDANLKYQLDVWYDVVNANGDVQ